MNRLALSDLLMKSCSKFQSEISNHLDNVVSVPWHHLSKNLFVCTGLPVESEEICVCVAVECRWMHMDREGGGESMRDLGKRRRHGLGG